VFLFLPEAHFAPALQAAPAAARETPQERLKRLMQAQLNKAAQKDSLANAHKKIQVCMAATFGAPGRQWLGHLDLAGQ
jgi:hypothetical protein